MLRTSERTTQKACEFRWWLNYVENLQPHTSAPALRFGSLIHKAMAGWYIPGVKRGVHPATGFEQAYQEDLKVAAKMGYRDEDGKWNEAGELGVAMLNHYVDVYGKDDRWRVLVTEQPFQTVVYKDLGLGPEPWFVYTGVLDGVWEDRQAKRKSEALWIPDHKSTAGLGDSKYSYLKMDDQAGAYWTYGVDWLYKEKLLKGDQRLAGMLYNFLRKAMPDERQWRLVGGKQLYLNLNGEVSKKQPSPYFMRMPIWRDNVDGEAARARAEVDFGRNEAMRQGEIEISKNPGMFTCPHCWASDICELHETGNDYRSVIKTEAQKWDPYAEHEVYIGR